MREIFLSPPGKKGENLKPSQRTRALILNNTELDNITSHLQWQARQAQDGILRRTQIERMKTGSSNIVKNWKNTVLNKQKERAERRLKRIQDEEDRKCGIYMESTRQAAEERKKKIDDARRMLMYEKDYILQVNSALRFSEVLRERSKQVEFNNHLKEIEESKERELAEKIKLDVKVHQQEEEECKAKEHEAMLQRRAECIRMIKEKAEHESTLYSSEMELEKQDQNNMERELKMINENREKELKRKKDLARKDALESIAKATEQERLRKLEDEEEEKVNKIYLTVKNKLERMRKEKEAEARQAKMERQDRIRAAIANSIKDKKDDTDALIAKALQEREEREEVMRAKKEAYQAKLLKERSDFLLEEEEKLKEEATEKQELKRWANLQRMKRAEIDNLLLLKRKEAAWAEKMDVRLGYNAQIEEHRELKRLQQEEELALFYSQMKSISDEDSDFFSYAKEVLEECKEVGRPLYPIEKVIRDYRKKYGIAQREKLEKMMREMAIRKEMDEKEERKQEKELSLTVYEPAIPNFKFKFSPTCPK